MPALTWLALLFFLLASALGALHAVREAIRLFQTLGSSGRRVGHALDEVATASDEVARRLEALPGKTERLNEELALFSVDRAELGFLLRHFAEFRRTVLGLRALALGK